MTTTISTSPSSPARRRGAPTKYSEEVAEAIVAAVSDGIPALHAAQIAGISFQTLCEYRRVHPEFDQQVKEAISRGIRARLEIVKKAMQSKDENVALRAACWWLSHCPGAAEHFSETRRLEISGDGLPPIQIVVAVDASKI